MPIKQKHRRKDSKIPKQNKSSFNANESQDSTFKSPEQTILYNNNVEEVHKNYDQIVPNDIMIRLDTREFNPEDLKRLFLYLKYCHENGILNDRQIQLVNQIFESQVRQQTEIEFEKNPVPEVIETENRIRTNLVHMGISYFIWNASGRQGDPTLYGNLYRQKIREARSKENG